MRPPHNSLPSTSPASSSPLLVGPPAPTRADGDEENDYEYYYVSSDDDDDKPTASLTHSSNGSNGGTSGPATTTASGCSDNHPSCPGWSRLGECQNNPAYMTTVCAYSCNACGSLSSTSSAPAVCADNHPSCQGWAAVGECQNNPAYMLTECRRACGSCTTRRSASEKEGRRGKKMAEKEEKCQDTHPSCSAWAEIGECEANSAYMLMLCKRACGVCIQATASSPSTNYDAQATAAAFPLEYMTPFEVKPYSIPNTHSTVVEKRRSVQLQPTLSTFPPPTPAPYLAWSRSSWGFCSEHEHQQGVFIATLSHILSRPTQSANQTYQVNSTPPFCQSL